MKLNALTMSVRSISITKTKENRPGAGNTEAALSPEGDHKLCKVYCIILWAAMQAEHLFSLAVIFIPIFKGG